MSKVLKEAIDAAYSDVPPPSQDEICASVGDEAIEDTGVFRGKRWQAVADPEFLDEHYHALFWFAPEAFHYYLPAFLKGGVEKPDAIFVITIFQLLRPREAGTQDAFRKHRWGLLTEPQLQALEKWLQWLVGQTERAGLIEGEVKGALEIVQKRFWW